MFARAIRISAVAAAAGLCLSAQAANPAGIGQSGSMVWEQVRFYGPSSGADSTYTGGQPTYLGSVASDACSGADRCGEPMTFATQLGGALTVTASDDGNGMQNNTNGIVYQDLSPTYGGLGVMSRNESTGAMTGGDEINKGDTLTLSFANAVKIVGFHFWDKDHQSNDLNNGDTFSLSVNGGAAQTLSLSNFPWYGASSTLVGNSFTFGFTNEDYYLGAIKVSAVPAVPEPQTYALMLAGLGAVMFMARRRRGVVVSE
jgi:hypothetical protein